MKKNASKRVLSAFLAFVMVFLMIPFSMLNVSAAADYSVPTTGHKLLSSYNVLSGTDISSGDADITSSLEIFNRDKLDELINKYASYTNMHTQYGEVHEGRDMESFAANVGVSLSYSTGANVGIEKLFKASATKKFGFDFDVAYSDAIETYFYEYVVSVQKGYYSFNEANLDQIKDYSNGYLSDAFINALTGADGSTPEEFFKEYGTHILTAYTAGGEAGISLSSVQTDTSLEIDLSAEYSSGAEASGTIDGITAGMNSALELKGSVGVDNKKEGFDSDATIYAYGGTEAVAFSNSGDSTTFNYSDWLNSLNEENAMILVDERLEMIPIWNLLPKTGYEDRILELTMYFIENSEQQDSDFYQYFGIDESLFDYSMDWLNFDNCKIITNEEELNNIRNDLNGVYVLANNIVLSDYADWCPIGTDYEPFRGRLYGNNNTIFGLNISAENNADDTEKTFVGLFGCNDGLITDLKISGNISIPEITNSNSYVGAISAYNQGIISNCFDDVSYDIDYKSTDYLNLPIDSQDVETDKTYYIGDELGIYLTGQVDSSYSNVNIVIEESNNVGPVYIVLENVNITGNSENGTIYNSTERTVYIISKGTSNTIKGKSGDSSYPAINVPNANLHIFGNATLCVNGGNGASGTAGSNGGQDENGGAGTDGKNGATGIIADNMYVSASSLMVYGGTGGNGGKGGNGNSAWYSSKNRSGGKGGNGGLGGTAISLSSQMMISAQSDISIYGGTGGNGGNGGASGDDGKSGKGGDGGNGGVAIISTELYQDNTAYLLINNGAGGIAGSAGSITGNGSSGGNGSDGESASVEYDVNSLEAFRDSLLGLIIGCNAEKGKARKANNIEWQNNVLQINSVSKSEYYSDETFDSETVEISMYDKIISGYSQSYNFSCNANELEKMECVKITKDDYTRYIPFHVTKVIPDHIEIAEVGQTEFAVGEKFDISGLSVKVIYNSGKVYTITDNSILSYTIPSIQYANQTETVTVTYEESGFAFSTSYQITTVTDTIDSIFIQTPATTTYYEQGEELNIAGLEIYGVYKSGAIKLIDNNYLKFDVSPSLCNVGTSVVTIKYEGKTVTYMITVEENKNFNHAWDDGIVTVDPTHTATGIMTYHCTVENCDATKTETIPALEGHTYGDWYKLNDTQHQRMCECGDTIVLDHVWDAGITITPATHLAEGEILHTCSVCDATETRVVEKTSSHSFSDWSRYDNIQHSRICECGEIEYKEHNWDTGTVTTEPTYTTTGSMTYTCGDCKATTTEVIPVLEIPENAPWIVVDTKNAVIGSTVTVKIGLTNNLGVTSMRINVAYDSALLTLAEVKYNTAMGGQTVLPENIEALNGNVVLYWADGFANYEGDDVFATLTFKVSDNAVVDTTTTIAVTYDAEDIYDADESNVTFFCEDGVITFIDYIPGDISGDGILNSKDTTRLMRYLAGWDVEINEAALDVNGDGVVNTKDTTRLMRYLAGWDVEIF